MQAYCVRCKAKQDMLSPTRTLTKNGRRAMLGQCACCGTKVSVMGVWDMDPVPAAPSPAPAHHEPPSGAPALPADRPRPV